TARTQSGRMGHENGDAVLGKIASLSLGGWNCGLRQSTRVVAKPLVATEVECLVPKNLPSRRRAKLIPAESRLRNAENVVEQIVRVQGIITQEIVGRTVESIGTRLRRDVDLGGSSAKFRRVGVGF